MPGLARAMVGTAVVAGTAQASRNAINRRQARKNTEAYADAAQEVQATHQPTTTQPAPQPVVAQEDPVETIKKLAQLHDQGILTDAEFEAKKAEQLAKM